MIRALYSFAVALTLAVPGPPSKRTAVVVANAEPRSFQIVRVPIPAELKGVPGVRFTIDAEREFRIIGPASGSADAIARTDVVITLAVAGDALAGTRVAARATFSAAGRAIEVPIEMRVSPQYRINVTADAGLKDIYPSDRIEIAAIVRNDGNTTDSVRMTYVLPAQWRTSTRDTLLILAPRTSAHRLLRLTVPRNGGTGSFFVRTNVTSRGGATASALTTLNVGSNPGLDAPPGPSIRTTVGAVGVENGASRTVAQLAINGAVTNNLNLDARISTKPDLDPAALRGLARVGAFVSSPHIGLSTDAWRFDVGNTIVGFNDLTGINAGGNGLAFAYNGKKNDLSITAARPSGSHARTADNSLVGFEYGRMMGATRLSASGSRLRNETAVKQELTAGGIEIARPFGTANVFGALAYRNLGEAGALGWSGGIKQNGEKTKAELRITHAPGGSEGFARAEHEVTASISRALTDKYDVSASLFRSSDHISQGLTQARSGSITQQYALTQKISLRADLRTTTFNMEGQPFSFGSSENHVGAGASLYFGGITYTGDFGYDRITRTLNADDIDAATAGNRLSWHGSAAHNTSFGSISLETSYDRTSNGASFAPEQMMVSVAARRAVLPFGPQNLYFDADVGYNRRTGIGSVAIVHGGVTYALPQQTDVSFSIERNPLFYGLSRNAPWVLAMRIDKAIGLPRINTNSVAGIVFQDYNGNGRRDANESGMADIVVVRGNARATSTSDGRYRFWQEGHGAVSVDPSSLPYGWMANTRTASGDIALVPTTRVEVLLEPGTAERIRNVDLSGAAVIARDSAGREYIARRTGEFTAVFEALPAGAYQIDADFSAIAEPMRVDGEAPRIVVTRDQISSVIVRVSGRPLRFKQNPPASK